MYAMLFIHFEPTGHSLRHGAESSVVKDVHAQYKAAAAEGVGGQSASDRGLPPYIIRESPEESHWRASHPNGWIEVSKNEFIYFQSPFLSNKLIYFPLNKNSPHFFQGAGNMHLFYTKQQQKVTFNV